MPGITQVQMKDQIGLNFAQALRSFLRQDPNIILVGEIRDFETAEIAIKAALTGHMVLSTLHTNDAPSTISRLMNIGIEPFLVATSVHLICAQRLVRKICPKCKVEDEEFTGKLLMDAGYEGGSRLREGLQGHRLPRMRRQGVQGAHRAVRGPGGHRRHP
jgi:type IV pilus assembly protein PilB